MYRGRIIEIIVSIVCAMSISHKIKQIQMQNVDSVHFSQNAIISHYHTCHVSPVH